jgi:Arc/MetJ-type ribon-helix-helix transcriptional regulator
MGKDKNYTEILRVRLTKQQREELEQIRDQGEHAWDNETEFLRFLIKLGLETYKKRQLALENKPEPPPLNSAIERFVNKKTAGGGKTG